MKPNEDNQDQRLEKLLRVWGRDEAVRKADIAPTEEVVTPADEAARRELVAAGLHPRPAVRWLWRWGPLAAAAVVLVAATGVWLDYAMRAANKAAAPAANTAAQAGDYEKLQEQMRELRGQHATAVTEMEEARTSLADARKKLSDAQRQHEADLAVAKGDASHQKEKAGEFAAELDKKKSDLAAAETQAADAAGQVEKLKGQLTALAAAQKQADELKAKVTDFEKEQAKLTQMLADARESVKGAHAQAASAAHRDRFAAYQKAYLAMAGEPNAAPLRQRQLACKKAKLVERLGEARKAATDESTKKLLDRLEVVLTQLEIIDFKDAPAVAAFTKLLVDGKLVKDVTAALDAGKEPPAMQAVLAESLLVLEGADHVG